MQSVGTNIMKSRIHFVEISIGIAVLFVICILLSGLLLISITPINNFHYSIGVVEYKNRYKVVSQKEGVVDKLFHANNSPINRGDTIIKIFSEENRNGIDVLKMKVLGKRQELENAQSLYEVGSFSFDEVRRRSVAYQEMLVQLEILQNDVILSPYNGILKLTIDPEFIEGTFVHKNEELGYIFSDNDKVVKISFDNIFTDRFRIGSRVIFKYRDPKSLIIKKMNGYVYRIFINEIASKVELFCNTDTSSALTEFQPSTMLDALVIINTTSILSDLIGTDIEFPVINKYIQHLIELVPSF